MKLKTKFKRLVPNLVF